MRLLLATSMCLSLLTACSDGCRNEVVARQDAPDRQHTALLFQRDCGATTGFSTQVSVLGPGEQPPAAGNAFVADGGGAARVGSWGGPWAELVWVAPRHLLVRYATGARTFHQSSDVGGIAITYQAVP